MSKSKKNVIDPEKIILMYGSDTARWFMLSDSPPDRDLEWTDSGIGGSYKFINKIWRLVNEVTSSEESEYKNLNDDDLNQHLNTAIVKISQNIEDFHFNKSVANVYELINIAQKFIEGKSVSKKSLLSFFKKLALLIHPFIPHLSEEIWKELKFQDLVINQSWPKISSEIKILESNIAVQINGKTRAVLKFKKGASKKEIEKIVISNDKIGKYIQDKNFKKVIFVPEKIINFVI